MKSRKSKTTSKAKRAASKTTSRSSAPKSKSKASASKPKSAPAQAKRPAPKSASKGKRQTKTPPQKTTKKKYEKPMVLMPVRIKDYRDKNGGHHHVIVDDVDDKHVSVGLTQDKYKGKNATNYKCQISPLEDGKKSYMRRQAQVAPKTEYYNPRSGKMEMGDYQRAQEYGERAKNKYLEKKSKKNSNEVPNA